MLGLRATTLMADMYSWLMEIAPSWFRWNIGELDQSRLRGKDF